MGTDIHTIIEVRHEEVWAGQNFPSCELPDGKWNFDEDYEPRNYTWFAALAGVRNGFNFEPLEPIAVGRGLPKDASPEVLTCMDRGGWTEEFSLGEHSHTYVTLRELQDHTWGSVMQSGGVISMEAFKEWDRESVPESHSGSVGGPSVITLTQEQAEAVIEGFVQIMPGKRYFVEVSWANELEDSVKWILDRWVNYLEPLGGPDDVRVVIGFDS